MFSAVERLLETEDPDAVVLRAIELAAGTIGLVRPSVHLRERIDSETCGVGEGLPDSVLEPIPSLEHRSRTIAVAGRRSMRCTPIRYGRDIVGMLLNESECADDAFHEGRQAQAAILCSLLGIVLGSLARVRSSNEAGGKNSLRTHRLLMATVTTIIRQPGLTAGQIARRLAVGPGRLDRTFEARVGISLAEYRLMARLERLSLLMTKRDRSLPDAVVAAGFASFTQFQSATRALHWMTFFRRQA